MQHEAEKYLFDILSAARDILEFVGNMSFDEYHANKLVKAAVERKFEIIGEALNRISRHSPATADAIQDYAKIIAFRNIVIHGYDVVSDPIVWDVVQNKLPLLIADVEQIEKG
jgi:uncharacterized protein with HEPN domain